MFARTCQECGHIQKDDIPAMVPIDTYLNRKCKKCKSEALDYGSNSFEEVNGKIVRVNDTCLEEHN